MVRNVATVCEGLTCSSIGWQILGTQAASECIRITSHRHATLSTCDIAATPSSLVKTQRKATDGSNPCWACGMLKQHRQKMTLTLPLIAISAPPDARAFDGIIDAHDGNMKRDSSGKKSRDESDTSKAAAPPAPVQVWQLKLSPWLTERRHLAAGTYMHSIMVDERGIVFWQAAVAPPGPAMPQE